MDRCDECWEATREKGERGKLSSIERQGFFCNFFVEDLARISRERCRQYADGSGAGKTSLGFPERSEKAHRRHRREARTSRSQKSFFLQRIADKHLRGRLGLGGPLPTSREAFLCVRTSLKRPLRRRSRGELRLPSPPPPPLSQPRLPPKNST